MRQQIEATMTHAKPQDTQTLEGTLLGGKYRLERLLGAGGMGAVYAAENTSLRAPVAVKVLHAAVVDHPELRDRFAQEAQAAAQVRHANIVGVLDFGYDDDAALFYIVQEFLPGDDLKRRVRERGPMAPREAIELLLPVMRALSFAHSKGVVHRDLKPDNVFLCETPDGVVPKVIDFGIAKVVDAEGQSLQHTSTRFALGTPSYMSPEQARGDRALDHRTDVWSLGVVLYFTLTGQLPYQGATANVVLANIITQTPARIESHLPDLAPDVAALVHRALAYLPEDRFQTMEAFWRAARACSALRDAPQAHAAAVTPTVSMLAPTPSFPGAAASGPYLGGPAPVTSGLTAAPRVLAVAPAARGSTRWRVAAGILALALLGGLSLLGLRARTRTVAATPPAAAPRSAPPAPPVITY